MINSHLLAIWKDIQKSSVTSNSQSRDFMPIILGKKTKNQAKTKQNKKPPKKP